ncbi:MAG: NAD(P)H-hydrate epimerase, partial [Deltaproteobacteria bacterium]|nr:NAD(P)H-hydrate epimerase [Deltaproteobacteria bacterium]
MVKSFFTDTGIEVPAVTTDQMQEVDRIAIEGTGPNLFQMME